MASFDNDECRIFFETTGTTIEELWLGDTSYADMFRKDGFLNALAHIAYRRAHRESDGETVRTLVGKQNRLRLLAALLEQAGEDDAPGEDSGTTSVPNESSTSSNSENESTRPSRDGSSGKSSETSSVPQVVARGTTGTGESDISSTSPPLRQVV